MSAAGTALAGGKAIVDVEQKYKEVRQLVTLGEEKGYLVYEEIHDLLPGSLKSQGKIRSVER